MENYKFNKTAVRVASLIPGEKGASIDAYFDEKGWQLQEWHDGVNPAGYQVYFGKGVSVDNSFEYGFPYLFDQDEAKAFFEEWNHISPVAKAPDYRTVKVIAFRHDSSYGTNFSIEPCPSTKEKIAELVRKVQRDWDYDENDDGEFFSWEVCEVPVDVSSLPSAPDEVIKGLKQAEKEHLQYVVIPVSREESLFVEHFIGLTGREIKDLYGMEPGSSLLYEAVCPNGNIGKMTILVPDDSEYNPDIFLSVFDRGGEEHVSDRSDQEYFVSTHEIVDECLWDEERWIYEFAVKVDDSMKAAYNSAVNQMILASKREEGQV